MRITRGNADKLQFFLMNWVQVRDESSAKRWNRSLRIRQRCGQYFFLLMAVLSIIPEWSNLLHALHHDAWLEVFHACESSLVMLSFLSGLSIFMMQMKYISDGVLTLRSHLDDEQFAPFAAGQPVFLTQEQLSLLPQYIGPLRGKFGRTIFSRFTMISVDEQSMSWKQAGKNHSLMWNDIRGFYCIKYQNNRGHDNVIYIIDSPILSFIWFMMDNYRAAEGIAYEQLSCLVVTRTQLPLRDISVAVAELLVPEQQPRQGETPA